MLIDQFAGLRNDVPTDRFDPNDLAVANNVVVDDSQKITRRPGVTLKSGGAKHSLWTNEIDCYFVSGDTLYQLQPDMTETPIKSGLTPGARMSYAMHADRLYFANGYELGVVDEGIAREWGIEVPPLPVASATTGSMDPGTYQYSVTYVAPDGQESGAGPAGSIEVTDGGIDFVFAPLPGNVSARVLYVSTANGETLFEAQVLTGDSTTLTGFDDVVPLETMNLCPPPAGVSHVVEYFGHVLVASGSVLYHSQTYGSELFDLRDYLVMGEEITMLAPTDEGMFIGTESRTVFLSGRSPEEFSLTYPASYGVARGSLAYVQARLLGFDGVGESLAAMWLSHQGVCVGLPGGGFYNLTNPKYQRVAASREAAAVIQKINGSTYYVASI